jgi:putative mRNA 3-end processing factor
LRQERVGWANGIVFDAGGSRLIFDPTPGRPFRGDWHVFVTHAHSDHTYGFVTSARKYSTRETLGIYEALRERAVKNAELVKMGETLRFDHTEVTALNAGHMLGSCMYEVVTPNFTAIYTGDINCVDTLTTRAADHKSCDYLVIEATYGHPSYLFPKRSTMYADIVRWSMTEIEEGKTPTFQVYSSGKPQELVMLFNVYTKIPVVCSATITRANQVHDENGLKLDYVDSSSPEGKRMMKKGGCVYITSGKGDHAPKNASPAVTTGWALRQAFRRFTSFPLSSHADYEQLIQFVKEVNPKKVYIFTGYTDILASQIERRLGIRAAPLPVISQTKLQDFNEAVT